MIIWNYRQLKLRKVVYTIEMIDDTTIKVILVVRAENDLSTELNVSWAGSSSSSYCSNATSVSLTLYEPAGNTTATDIAQTPCISSCTS